MSKVYKCDACGMMIENPYQIKMKEFYVDLDATIKTDKKRRIKIQLCDDCFRALHEIAKEKIK